MQFGARFLTSPELFPARQAGETWGEHEVAVHLAGGPYLVSGLDAPQRHWVRQYFGELCGDPAPCHPAAVRVGIYRAMAEDFITLEYDGRAYWLDRDYGVASVRIAGDGLMGRIDWNPGLTGALWVPRSDGLWHLAALENYLRALVAYRLLDCGGVLLHSAGVVRDERAYVFFGPSGAGKTTVSRLALAAGLTVLSDDLNALVAAQDTILVAKLPFAGDLGRTAAGTQHYPLRALLRLAKARAHALEPLSAAHAVGALLACSPYVNADPYRQDRLAENLGALARRVGVSHLHFTPDAGIWDHLP